MTSSYQGYAQRKGFSPINVGSQNIQNIRAEGQRIIQGMEARRNAEISSRNAVLSQMKENANLEANVRKENFDAEERYYDSIKQSLTTNYEVERDNIDRKLKADNKIYEALSGISETAAKSTQQLFQYKFDRDYEDEISKLLLGYIDPNKQTAQAVGQAAIEVSENQYQGAADVLQATGTPPLKVAQVRAASPGRQYARDQVRAAQAAEEFPSWLAKQMATNDTTKILVPGRQEPITPMQAVTSQEKLLTANTLAMDYLKITNLYGLKPEFLTPTLQSLRKNISGVVKKAEAAEIASLQEEQLNLVKDQVYDKVSTSQSSFLSLYNAFRRTTDANGIPLSPGQARKEAMAFIINAKNADGSLRFTQSEINDIFSVSFSDQPNNPISNRYSAEVAQFLADREKAYIKKVNDDQALVDAQQTEEYQKARIYLDNAPVITDQMIEQLTEAGKSNPKLLQLAERYSAFTVEAQKKKAINQDFEDKFQRMELTSQMVNTSLLPSDEKAKWIEKLEKAGMVGGGVMSKDDKKFAKDYISSRLKGLLEYNGTPSEFAETQSSAVRYALLEWNKAYNLAVQENQANPYEVAKSAFDAQIALSKDGLGDYRVKGEPRDQVFEKFAPGTKAIPITQGNKYRDQVRADKDAFRNAEMLSRDEVQRYADNAAAGRITALPQGAFTISNIYGGRLSAMDVLKGQAEKYDIKLPEYLIKQTEEIKEALNGNDPFNQLLLNFKPNYTRSQIVQNNQPGAWRQPQNIVRGLRSDYVGSDDVLDTGYVDDSNRPIRLSPPAAQAFKRMVDAGMPLTNFTNVYRDEDEYLRLKGQGYAAASNSAHNHGEGMDVHGPAKDWLITYGEQYGWYLIDYEGSHGGHFEYRGN